MHIMAVCPRPQAAFQEIPKWPSVATQRQMLFAGQRRHSYQKNLIEEKFTEVKQANLEFQERNGKVPNNYDEELLSQLLGAITMDNSGRDVNPNPRSVNFPPSALFDLSTIPARMPATHAPAIREGEEEFDMDKELELMHSWCFWYQPRVTNPEDYDAALKELCTFSTVQDFWRCFNNLPSPSTFEVKASMHMMRTGVSPKWEDPFNEDGGHWVLKFRKSATDLVWRDLILAIIGEQFTPNLCKLDEITGLSISMRKHEAMIRIWNKDAKAKVKDKILTLAKQFINTDIKVAYYKVHSERPSF